jgi:hypothetical protein
MPKPLQENIKMFGDWIKINRRDRNLTLGQLGVKMGIAHSLIRAWAMAQFAQLHNSSEIWSAFWPPFQPRSDHFRLELQLVHDESVEFGDVDFDFRPLESIPGEQ